MAVGSEELLLPSKQVIKVEHFTHERMSMGLVDQWGEGIPSFDEANTLRPEWRATPVIPLDLSGEGYGEVYVKDESDPNSNPTGTIKDRAAWELATLYRDFARALYLKLRAGVLTKTDIPNFKIPSLSLITAGNEGVAIAERFKTHGLPPPKLIVSRGVSGSILEQLRRLRASVYLVDLSQRALTTQDILALTDNSDGIDITSVQFIEPQAIFYDWHVHEVFNEKPHEVYLPYGSGRLAENYLCWQERSVRNDSTGKADPRLQADVATVAGINVLAAEPTDPDSIADKLTARFKPFLLFHDQDIRGLQGFSLTGSETGIIKADEEHIREAHRILTGHGIDAEPSAAAGLAAYMQRWEQKLIDPRKKVMVVNSGKGLYQEK